MTPTDICNLALSHLGETGISDITENTPKAIALRAHFESVRDALLRAHPWGFASARAELSATDSPLFGWGFAYHLPADYLRLKTLNGRQADMIPEDYEIEGRSILCDAEVARITYVKRVTDPNEFDASFVEALALKLAEATAMQITGMPDKLATMAQLAAMRMDDATFVDAGESRAVMMDPLESDLLRARGVTRNYDPWPTLP